MGMPCDAGSSIEQSTPATPRTEAKRSAGMVQKVRSIMYIFLIP